jgi:two-component system, chemotaxis family, chemotaxis protein CheY
MPRARRATYAESMRVMVVEESPLVRDRLNGMLREAGASDVLEADGAETALRIMRRGVLHAVLLDLPLGQDASVELIRQLRSQLPLALIVVLTNDASESHRREWLRRGAHLLFDKSRQFEDAVRSAVERTGGAG